MDYLNYIKNIFQNSSDLISKKIKDIDIVFLESLCSSDKINELGIEI